jgi:nucleotide-binding universal stress UspA family protein
VASTFRRLLLATEHSEYDRGAEALAFALARRCGLPLAVVLPVVSNPEYDAVAPQAAARADALAAARRQELQDAAREQGVAFEISVRHGPEPFAEIVAEACVRASDLIVIRRRGRRGLLANLLIGEMVSKVVAHAPCSVLVTPREAGLWTRRVMVGVDPLEPERNSLMCAADIAAECSVPLHVVCVAASAATRPQAEQSLKDALGQLPPAATTVSGEVRVGRAHQELIAAAGERGADLLVVARHGGAAVSRAWIGGTAQKVIGLAECPVLVHVSPPPAGAT